MIRFEEEAVEVAIGNRFGFSSSYLLLAIRLPVTVRSHATSDSSVTQAVGSESE